MIAVVVILFTILEISLAVSPLILLIFALTPFLEHRYSPKLQYLLWLVLAVRLLLIWNPMLELRTLTIAIPSESIVMQDLDNPAWVWPFAQEQQTLSSLDNAANSPASSLIINKALSLPRIATFIWLCGSVAFLSYHIFAYVYMRRKLINQYVSIQDANLIQQFSGILQELHIKKEIQLFRCDLAVTPVLIGFICPRIFLPASSFSPEQIELILRHELFHFKRRDLWLKLLFVIVRAVHWFNPLVHLMARQFNRAVELCCDTDVLQGADNKRRQEYGFAVLNSLEQRVRLPSALHSGFSDGKRQMKKRFLAIVIPSPLRVGWTLVSAVFAASILISGLVSCAPKENMEQFSYTSQNSRSGAIASSTSTVAFITPDLIENVLQKKQQNPDVVGWLHIPNTTLNDAILFQPQESNNYYTTIGLDGQPNKNGSYFADRRSVFGTGTREEFGRNTVIYGRSWDDDPDGQLFSQLKKYCDPAFARANPYIYFSTDKETIAWEVFSVFDAHVNLPYNLSEPQNMNVEELLTAIRESSIYDYDVAITPEDRMLTLSCNVYSVDGHSDLMSNVELASEYRFAIAARMVPANEALKKDAVFTLNPNPMPPDTYKNI